VLAPELTGPVGDDEKQFKSRSQVSYELTPDGTTHAHVLTALKEADWLLTEKLREHAAAKKQ
jgi:hypothetical protein